MLVLPTCKELPRSHSLASMSSRASDHCPLPQILILLPLLHSLNRPGFEIPVVRSCLTRSTHCGLNMTKYKSSNSPNFTLPNETVHVLYKWSHLSCELLISTRRPFTRTSYSAWYTPLLPPSMHLPGTGSWISHPVSSSIMRAQSSSTWLRRQEFMIASGWLLYISAVLPMSAQMCLNWEAPNVRKCLDLLNFWHKDFVPGRGQAWINFNNCISWSRAFHDGKLGSPSLAAWAWHFRKVKHAAQQHGNLECQLTLLNIVALLYQAASTLQPLYHKQIFSTPWKMSKSPRQKKYVHSRKLTWNPKMEAWKMIFLFKEVLFRFQPLVLWGVISLTHSTTFFLRNLPTPPFISAWLVEDSPEDMTSV